jgi:hypothetical protein
MGKINVDSNRDWRKSAYLDKDNWPEAISWCGPKREYGVYPWGNPSHEDLDERDTYPHMHPDSASVGDTYAGDVCPYCGVPIRRDEAVVLSGGTKGVFWDINEMGDPVPAWHPECWSERRAEKCHSLTEFVE